jgi:hypothetical protein
VYFVFDRIADNVWITARRQRFWGVETGTRMTIVRLGREGAGLFVHCPVALDAATRAATDRLGPVSAVVASSLYHHLYVGEWIRAYPQAKFFACPGLQRKRPDLRFDGTLGDEADVLWADHLQQIFFSARFEKEVVFFHEATGTLITADVLLNLRHHPSAMTRLVALLMGNTAPGKGYFERVAVRDWKLGRRQVDRILEWQFERIVLAHGALVEHAGREVLREAYAWLR